MTGSAPGRTARGRGGLRRALRSPRLVVGEVLAVALAGVALAALPQATERADRVRFALDHPLADRWVSALALDRVLHAPWFLAIVGLATASLSVVLVDQWRRELRRGAAPAGGEDVFDGAQYRIVLDLPAEPGRTGVRPESRVERRGRVGRLGSPLFHLGLMLVLLAGIVRALFGAEAGVTLVEGEEVGPDPAAFAQLGGPLARPFALERRLRLVRVLPARYPSGGLARLSLDAAVERGGSWAPVRMAINAPLDVGAERLYVRSSHGPAALLEVESEGEVERRIVPLEDVGGGRFAATQVYPGATEVRLAAEIGPDAALPGSVEVRVLRRGGLLHVGPIAPGEGLRLAGGGRVVLHGLRYWVDLQGSRDRSVPLAYAGFALLVVGVFLMFAVVPVDTAVRVEPAEGGRTRVEVALRARRFAPLFAERFGALVREVERRAAL